MKAKKSLGQHFLRSERALDLIVKAGDIKPEDIILEIGPGTGVLTEKLLETGAKVIAVEKDDGLFRFLQEKFARKIRQGKLDLVHGDILDFNPEILKFYKNHDYKLIANIPYNITGAILEKFLSADQQPELMVLLVQKEVAQRIVAKDNKESILSVSVKAYGKPVYIEPVKAGSFAPAPKVDSAIIAIEGISKDFFRNFPEKGFFRLLRTGFKAKRKKLLSNLSLIFEKEKVKEAFQGLNLDENTRAEELPVEMWQQLASILIK
ncbi:MAG: 16S rRNA (adenine(1518)-N(6)/adenine(1519)-N(6))-dimethyltransferase RsmA [Patescibacteria group bacterium]